MKKKLNVVQKIKYPGREGACISIALIENPYKTENVLEDHVVSIGVALKQDHHESPTWKVHIPVDAIHDVINCLQGILEGNS